MLRLLLEVQAQVVVIGAGIIGASIAWSLSKLGVVVILVDAGDFGGEASWAGAGMLAPGWELTGGVWWQDLAIRSRAMYPAFVAGLSAEARVPIDYRDCGAIEIAETPGEWAALEAKLARQFPHGIEARPLSHAEVLRRIPAFGLSDFAGAAEFPGDGMVDPRDIMAALRVACASRGVTILERCPAKRVAAVGSGAEVSTASGTLRAAAVVLAAGAWTSQVCVEPTPPGATMAESLPVRGHLIGYRLPPGVLHPILRRGQTYLLQRSNGFFIAGASEERVGFDRSTDPAVESLLRHNAERYLPSLLRGVPSETWVGFRPATPSLEPQIGPIPGVPIWLAHGHYRNGILMAPATAELVAGQITSSLGIG